MDLNLISYFINASLSEKAIMLVLITASFISWIVIFQRMLIINKANKTLEEFEENFWSGIDLNRFYKETRQELNINSGIKNVFCSGFREFGRLEKLSDADVIIGSIHRVMRISIFREEEYLNNFLPSLASIGSITPYIGLFGTVTGIIKAFLALSNTDGQLTIELVAPGIAQALFTTAMGLFAAIPAAWAYNHFAAKADFILAKYEAFADEFTSVLNRKLRSK